MSIQPVVPINDPFLREKSLDITSFTGLAQEQLFTIIQDLFDTMIWEKGVGLSAIQIGKKANVFVLYVDGVKSTYINPTWRPNPRGYIVNKLEGCLSDKGNFLMVPRYNKIDIAYLDVNGRFFTETLTGLRAQAYQHEFSHTIGQLYSDLAVSG